MKNKFHNLYLLIFYIFSIFLLPACSSSGTIISTEINDGSFNMDHALSSASSQDNMGNASFEAKESNFAASSEKGSDTSESRICVCITGAIENPGVYYLDKGSRVFELINAAGGLCPDADIDNLNLVTTLSDGMQLNILSKSASDAISAENGSVSDTGSDASSGFSSAKGTGSDAALGKGNTPLSFSYPGLSCGVESTDASMGKININTASAAELTALPSIGDTRARAIVKYREDNKGFKSIEDIKNVSGIKEGTFEKIKDLICVN